MILNETQFSEEEFKAYKVSLERISELIEAHPFSTRIKFLFNNRNLEKKCVKNKYGIVSAPNCIGTALFVAGVTKLGYAYQAYEDELSEHMEHRATTLISGLFNFSYSASQDNWHAGIYIGEVENDKIFFAQQGHGGRFAIESIRNYVSPRFYIPKTLL